MFGILNVKMTDILWEKLDEYYYFKLPSNGRDRVERTVIVKALRRSAEGGGAGGEGEAGPPVEDHGSCRVQ